MHISIIDDEKILSEKIAKKLKNNGFSATTFFGYRDFMEKGDSKSQLYIVDLSLRDGSGFDVVKWLRKDAKSQAPIIMISGYGDPQNKIYGLDNGADDYLVKPFLPEELIARINAILRRPSRMEEGETLVHNGISFDPKKREVSLEGSPVRLTRTEQILLETLMRKPGTAVSRESLISEAWGSFRMGDVSENTLSAHISNIKRKLSPHFRVTTEYGNGYSLEG